eukprot:2290188-Prymnesium_polylepis.1
MGPDQDPRDAKRHAGHVLIYTTVLHPSIAHCRGTARARTFTVAGGGAGSPLDGECHAGTSRSLVGRASRGCRGHD